MSRGLGDVYKRQYWGWGCNTKAIGEVLFLLLKYFASSLPVGPGINISKILLSIIDIDNYSQKKLRLTHVRDKMLVFFFVRYLTILVGFIYTPIK